MKRGQYICALLGLATCPWIVLVSFLAKVLEKKLTSVNDRQNSAKSFTSFLGGYSVFLGPVAGVMLSDYFIVRKMRLSLGDMFLKKDSVYWFTYGWNVRAVVAFVCGVAPTLPGFIRNVNSKLGIPIGAYYAYVATWPVGASTAAVVYVAANMFFKPRPLPIIRSTSSPSLSGSDDEKVEEDKTPGLTQVYTAA